jgi:hypothetical protein
MKKYAVDVRWDFVRSCKVEAGGRGGSERIVESMMSKKNFHPLGNGFEQIEDFEVRCSG